MTTDQPPSGDAPDLREAVSALRTEHPEHEEVVVGDGHFVDYVVPGSRDCIACRVLALVIGEAK